MTHEILLYYKYVPIQNPQEFAQTHRALCESLNLKGRIIIADEGLNGTVEGLKKDTDAYRETLLADPRFSDMDFKRSEGTGNAFPRLSIKVRKEIVSLHLEKEDFSPQTVTGKYLPPEELHEWIHGKKEFYIVDMRNDYEYAVGHFTNSIFPNLTNFRDLPAMLPQIEHLKGKTVVTVCTGGVRCEKASGFLLKNGFQDVYQLRNGIVSYMEKYPNEDFWGALYVFDGRITMAFNRTDPAHVIVGRCSNCEAPTERYVNCAYPRCNSHILRCDACVDKNGQAFCTRTCREMVESTSFAAVT